MAVTMGPAAASFPRLQRDLAKRHSLPAFGQTTTRRRGGGGGGDDELYIKILGRPVMDSAGRRLSSQTCLLRQDSASSLTSFPEPTSLSRTADDGGGRPKQPLHELLEGADGPSLFDDTRLLTESDPQALSAASSHVLQNVIDHRGAVEMVRRLAMLLAERDAHITALTRLAEEYKIPTERINEAGSRVKRAERRRLSLAAASEDLLSPARVDSDSCLSQTSKLSSLDRHKSTSVAVRGLTRLFGGNHTVRAKDLSPASSRSTSMSAPRSRADRRASADMRAADLKTLDVRKTDSKSNDVRSLDVRSIQSGQSADTSGWKDAAGNLFKNPSKRHDSPESREPVEMVTRHDKTQLPPPLARQQRDSSSVADPQEAAWNRFILHLMKQRQQNGESNGTIGLIGASNFGHEGQEGRQRMHTLGRLVVEGVPIHMRHVIWMELSNVDAIVQPQAFAHFLALGEDQDSGEREAILKDVPRTLTSKYDFYAEKGFTRLKEVLVAFVGKYKELGYTQVQEDAFWMLCNLVENFFPTNYFSGKYAMEAPQFDNTLLRSYVKQLMPHMNQHLDKLNIPGASTVPMRWFVTAFANVVSEALLMRIWDVWLCLPNQKHFLFNVALMLLIHNYDMIMVCETDSAFYAHLDNTLKVPEDPESIRKFIRDAFSLGKKLEDLDERRSQGLKWRLKRVGSVEVLMDEPLDGGDVL